MADQKVITIHVPKRGASNPIRLTSELVAVLQTIAEQLQQPKLHTSADGLVISVPSWSHVI